MLAYIFNFDIPFTKLIFIKLVSLAEVLLSEAISVGHDAGCIIMLSRRKRAK